MDVILGVIQFSKMLRRRKKFDLVSAMVRCSNVFAGLVIVLSLTSISVARFSISNAELAVQSYATNANCLRFVMYIYRSFDGFDETIVKKLTTLLNSSLNWNWPL